MEVDSIVSEFNSRLIDDAKELIESHAARLHTDLTIEEYEDYCFSQIEKWIEDFCEETCLINKICDAAERKDLSSQIRIKTLTKNDTLLHLRAYFADCVDTQLGRDTYCEYIAKNELEDA